MSKYRTISCGIDHRRLFETDSRSGVIEIKCMKCKNIVRINLENDEQYFPQINMRIATSKQRNQRLLTTKAG